MNMKTLVRLLSIGGIVAAVGLGAVATASAHAELDHSDPAAGAVLANSPARVTLTFIEEIQRTAGSYGIVVKNSAGQSVTSGAPTVGSDSMSLSIALKPGLPNDTYTVVWSNLSIDGDALTDEQFSFTVGTTVTDPSPTAMPLDMGGGATHTHDEPTPTSSSSPASPPTTGLIVIAMGVQFALTGIKAFMN